MPNDRDERDIYDEIGTWYSSECDERGDLPKGEKDDRVLCFMKLFNRLKCRGYLLKDIKSPRVMQTICQHYYPKYEAAAIKKRGRSFVNSWKSGVDKDFYRALYRIYIPDDEVGKVETFVVPEAPKTVIEEKFQRQSKELDRSLISSGMGAAKFEVDKEVCDFFGIPEDHRE
jgi:hypothetical protein